MPPLVVYCAAGLRQPVAAAADAFTAATDIPVQLTYGSSGDLEARMQLERIAAGRMQMCTSRSM